MIGMHYKNAKKAHGGAQTAIPNDLESKSTAQILGELYDISHTTVERNEKFADTVNDLAKINGTTPYDALAMLTGKSKMTYRDADAIEKFST